MRSGASRLDDPAARVIAVLIAVAALSAVGWLVYIDNREDPAVAACIRKQTAAITRARQQGALPADAAERFLATVADSCAAQLDDRR